MSVDYRPDYDPADVNSDYGHTGGDITVPTFTGDTRPFRFWCQKALPLVYDDSLSYYEVLCKMADYMNNFMTDLTTVEDSMTEFGQQFVINQQFINSMADQLGQNVADLEAYINDRMNDFMAAYTQLQTYVNNYFDNLDVQQEINTKLDEMASDGTLNDLFDPVLETWMQQKTAQIDAAIANQDAMQAQQNNRISVLEGRMDTFSGLPSGSTSGNAELLDIRTNFLGETYPTAGDAVRASDMIASGFQAISATQLEDWDGNASSSVYYTVQIDISGYKGGHVVVIGSFENFKADIENTGTCSVYATNTPGKTSDTNAVNYFPGSANSIFTNYTQITTSISGEERLLLQFAIPDDFAYQYLKIGHITDRKNPGYFTEPRYIVYANSWSKTQVDPTLTIAGAAADAKAAGDAINELNERLDDVKEEIDNVETALPKNYITTSLYDSLTFIDGHYVDLSGNIYEHNDMKYAVATSVSVGDVIRFKGRKLGSAYCILLVTSDTSISDKFTVLDAVTDGYSGTDYIESEYTVSQNGYIIYQTRMSSANNYLIKNSVNYYVADSRLLNETTDTLNYVKEQIPSKRIFTDITDDLSFTEHHYVDQNGNIYEYTDVQYAVAGAVSKDDVFEYDGRKVGSAYCILLVTSADPVNNKYTVLDAVNSGYSETDYIKGTYIVPQNGYLIFQTRITYTKCYLRSSQLYYMFGSSPLNGVKWVTIGDSLNAFDSLITNNWIKLMITETNANNTNLAISGTGFYRGLNTNTNYINRISAIPADTQLITIAGSFNDLSSSPLPEIEVGTATDTGTTTLAGYMNAFFDELLSNFPNASIGVYMTAPWQNYHYGVTRSDDYVNVLKEICLRRCIPFFDNAYYGNALKPWNTANRTEYYTKTDGTVDGVHPNDKGHVFIYQMLKPFIETLSPKSPLDV